MAKIDSLPPESLNRILELAGEDDPALTTRAAASLVARRWREPAQALMWLQLHIWGVGEAKRMTDGERGVWQIPLGGRDTAHNGTGGGRDRGGSTGRAQGNDFAPHLRLHWKQCAACGRLVEPPVPPRPE